MLKFLNQPYYLESDLLKNIRLNFWIGLFVAFFLIVFQPFGTENWTTEFKFYKLLGYGFVTFLMPTLLIIIRVQFVDTEKSEEDWTIAKEIFWLMLTLVSIAIGNMIYATWLDITTFSFASFLSSLAIVMVIGVFPILASIQMKYQRYLALNSSEAQKLDNDIADFQQKHVENEHQTPLGMTDARCLTFSSENDKEVLEVEKDQLLYLESADNYVNIVVLADQKVTKHLLRGTLRRFESQMNVDHIVRCHRSYIVNLQQVEHIQGNAQGYRISLKRDRKVIPVSRNYGAIIHEKLRK